MTLKDRTAIVGIGTTDYYRRGQSLPQTLTELAGQAVLAAVADAGLSVTDIDGFTYYAQGFDTGMLTQTLGIPEVRFSAAMMGGGSGSAGCVGLAATAIVAGQADVVLSLMTTQQAARRFGRAFATASSSHSDFMIPFGAVAPGHFNALITRRHMHLYGTRREHFAEVCLTQRANAATRPKALYWQPLTLDDYFAARMISDPLCILDYTMESDGAVAVITTSADRARDLRQRPVYVLAAAQGGDGRSGRGFTWQGMPDVIFATAGHERVAARLYERGGVTSNDVDVALFYDHFSPMVLFQLEDYGFCGRGESGPFVGDGHIRWPAGSIPVNTHGGHLSEAYVLGMTHVVEGVEQLRGTAINQVPDAEVALVTGGPSHVPLSALLLRR
jgi:acetyl-CoA acetyltransferase